jgi:hypothetical protein
MPVPIPIHPLDPDPSQQILSNLALARKRVAVAADSSSTRPATVTYVPKSDAAKQIISAPRAPRRTPALSLALPSHHLPASHAAAGAPGATHTRPLPPRPLQPPPSRSACSSLAWRPRRWRPWWTR